MACANSFLREHLLTSLKRISQNFMNYFRFIGIILASALAAFFLNPATSQFAGLASVAIIGSVQADADTRPRSKILGYASHNLTASELSEIKTAGGSFVRADFSMSNVQAAGPQSFEWAPLDAKVAAATAQGLQVLAILDYSPRWNSHPGCTVDSPGQCAPADPKEFAIYAAAAAAHFPQVKYWEIWNEPNLLQFWKPAPSPADYVVMLNQAYSAIKAVAPAAVVVSGGLSRARNLPGQEIDPVSFVTSMYANGAKFDVLALHPYTYPFSPDTANSDNGWPAVAKIRAIMVANGDSEKKIWITELGVPTCGPGSAKEVDAQPFGKNDYMTEAAQQTILSQALTDVRSTSYIEAFFVYEIMDDNSNDLSTRENCFGIFRSDDSPKAALNATRNN
jgi:polysaccharide biosynthesis protein PslG